MKSNCNHWDHFIFIVVTLIYWITLYIYVPILPPYLESRGVNYFTIGVILGSYGFMQIVFRLPLGIFSDWIQTLKPFLVIGLASAALGCYLFTVGGGWEWSLIARAVSGISASCWVAFTVLYANYFDKSDTLRAMSYITIVVVFGQLIGMGLSGWLVEQWGWDAAFLTGVGLGLVGLTGSFFIKEFPVNVSHAHMQAKDFVAVMREPILLQVSLLSILAHSILFITMFGFTPSLAVHLGASKSDLSLLAIAFMIPHAGSAYITSKWIVPKIGSWHAVLVGFIGSSLCTFALPFLPSIAWLGLSQVFNGFTQGMYLPLLLGLAIQNVDTSKRATAMGFYQTIYSIGMFAGPFMAGWLNESFGLNSGFYLGGALGVAAVVFILTFRILRYSSR